MPLFRQRLPSLHPNMTLEDIAKARARMERLPCSPQRSALAVRMNTMEQAKRDAERRVQDAVDAACSAVAEYGGEPRAEAVEVADRQRVGGEEDILQPGVRPSWLR